MKKRNVVKISAILIIFSMVLLILCHRKDARNVSETIYDNVDSIPHRKVGLFLGSSPISVWSGHRNHNEGAVSQAKLLVIDAIAFNSMTPDQRSSLWGNHGSEVMNGEKMCLDKIRGVIADITESMICNMPGTQPEVLSASHIPTEYGDLIYLKPDMRHLQMEMVCGGVPSANNDSIILAFAGSFTGTDFYKGHSNVAGDHVVGGKRYKGFRCKRNTGAFTWSPKSGPQFFFKNYSSDLDRAAKEGGMGFAQEMMIHNGAKVPTTRPLGNKNIFRALCLDSDGSMALYESAGVITFGKFIDALLQQGVKEALYTDMGQGWNYCFYRKNKAETSPEYLHSLSLPYASNFITIKIK